jgi:hypothetical protein
MRNRERTLSIRLDDVELAKLHALAEKADLGIGQMVRRWTEDHWRASFGDAAPPESVTRFGDPIVPEAAPRKAAAGGARR